MFIPVPSGLHPSSDPVWLPAPIGRPMRDQLRRCHGKEVSGHPSALDTRKSCIPKEILSDFKFFFRDGIVVSPHTPGILHECQNKGVAEIAIRKRMKRKSENFVG